jgi:hypothetical protein
MIKNWKIEWEELHFCIWQSRKVDKGVDTKEVD